MKFGQTVKLVDANLVVSNRHDAWMKENSNPTYTQAVLDYAREQLQAQAHQRDRSGSFSASSLDSCKRRQQFTYLGMPELPPAPKTAAIFQNGTFMHIRWQMAGLTAGWLTKAEVPVGENQYKLKGTMDGLCDDGSILELKSINTNGFNQVNTFGPKEGHLSQGATYALATGREKVVFIYEDKNTQEYREFVRTRDELPLEEVKTKSTQLWESIRQEELYEPLGSCMEKTGYEYTGCPYKDRCLAIRDWDDVK